MRTSQSRDEVAAILPSLELVLAAHATDAVPQGSGNAASASGKHDLTSRIIPGPESTRMLFGSQFCIFSGPELDYSGQQSTLPLS